MALARGEHLTELTVDDMLTAERARRPGFKACRSTPLPVSTPMAPCHHYRATPESHAVIAGDGLLLIDSGGQYLGGTTDITRVWPIGTGRAAQSATTPWCSRAPLACRARTFPQGTLSPMLDALAAPLWAAGCDYGHGTGHGVGYFLNVHEGPQSISKTIADATHGRTAEA